MKLFWAVILAGAWDGCKQIGASLEAIVESYKAEVVSISLLAVAILFAPDKPYGLGIVILCLCMVIVGYKLGEQ